MCFAYLLAISLSYFFCPFSPTQTSHCNYLSWECVYSGITSIMWFKWFGSKNVVMIVVQYVIMDLATFIAYVFTNHCNFFFRMLWCRCLGHFHALSQFHPWMMLHHPVFCNLQLDVVKSWHPYPLEHGYLLLPNVHLVGKPMCV